MKQLKVMKLFAIAVALMSTLVVFDSCTTTECDGVECLNGGSCATDQLGQAVCECEAGFFGDACQFVDSCFNVICPDNATCEGGTCYCNVGFMGENCDVEIRSQFTGSYTAAEFLYSSTGTPLYEITYNVDINNASDVTEFIIANVGGFDAPQADVTAQVLDDDNWAIASYTDVAGRVFESVNANGDQIIGSYSADTGIMAITYTVTYTDGDKNTGDLVLTPQ